MAKKTFTLQEVQKAKADALANFESIVCEALSRQFDDVNQNWQTVERVELLVENYNNLYTKFEKKERELAMLRQSLKDLCEDQEALGIEENL